jgi:hypothetical protein
VWAGVVPYVKEAAARARLHDLLFERRIGNGRDRAVEAVEAYLELAGRKLRRAWRNPIIWNGLSRSLEIGA